MMRRKAAIALVALLAAAAPAAAFAEAAQPPRQEVTVPDFAALDANKDGKVTREEFLAALPADRRALGNRLFDARDANKDGVITPEEMAPKR